MDKRVVWEYHNPHRVGSGRARIVSLFEMQRLPHDFPMHSAQVYSEPVSGRSHSRDLGTEATERNVTPVSWRDDASA